MKVAIVAEWLDPWRGGAETSTLQFIHELRNQGVGLHLYTRSRLSSAPGMEVHTIPGLSVSRSYGTMNFLRKVNHVLADRNCDIVHAVPPCLVADVYQPRGGTVAETVERNLALRRSHAVRNLKRYANHLNFKQRHLLKLERRILAAGERPFVVAISDYVVRQLKKHYSLPDDRIHKIYNAVMPDQTRAAQRLQDRNEIRRRFGIADDELLVLLVSHNFRLKGVQRWMEALAVLVKQGPTNIRSLVVGKGESAHWHRLAARLGISEHLTFTGPSDRVAAFFYASDVLVHPTYYDPCSRVVLEALASGLPCITTRWDGAGEMIQEGKSGFVIDDPSDIEGLIDRVRRLASPETRRAMGACARAQSLEWNMARHVQEMLALYERLLSRS